MNAFGSGRFGTFWNEPAGEPPGRDLGCDGGWLRSGCWALRGALLMITVADAAGEKSAKPSEFIFIVQIVLLIAVGRGLGEIMQRIGQPSVIGELLGGLLLGPSLFGWLWPCGAKRDLSRRSRTEGA